MAYLSLVISNIILIIPKNSQASIASAAPSICIAQTQEGDWDNHGVSDEAQIPTDLFKEDIKLDISSAFAKLPQIIPPNWDTRRNRTCSETDI